MSKLDKILREYIYDYHENCDDSCGKKADYTDLMCEIKQLFQELIDEVIGHDLEYRETEDLSLKTWSADDMKAFGRNELKIYQRQRAIELMEKM